jgi:hypothetical protein
MGRADDYRTNVSGWGPSYELEIEGLGLNLWGRTPLSGQFGPEPSTTPGSYPLLFADFSNGMGMAYSGVPNTYAFAHNMYMRSPRKAMPGGLLTEISLTGLGFSADELAGEIRCAMDHNSDVLIGAGRHILRLIGGVGAPWDEADTGVDTQLDGCLNYNGFAVFSTDQYADNYQYLTGYDVSTDTWVTANSDGTVPGYTVHFGASQYRWYPRPVYLEKMVEVFQEVDGIGGNRIVGNDTPFTYVQTQVESLDLLIGDTSVYSSSLKCGPTSYGINGIYPTNHIFFIGKSDGIYGIESSGIYCPNYVPDMKRDISTGNGLCGMFIFGKLFVGTPQGLLMVDVANPSAANVPTYVNPSFYYTNETPVFGVPTAMTTDNSWLVVSLYNGTDSHICYTRPRETTLATIPNPMIWHGSECTIPGQRITMLHKTGLSGRPQMLVGTHDGTRMRLYTLSLPEAGDPYVDYLHGISQHRFATNGRLYLPFQDAENATAKKVVRRYEAQVDGLSLPIFDPVTYEPIGATQAGELSFYANADDGSRVFFETVEPGTAQSEWEEQGVVSDSPSATMIPTLGTTSGKQIGVLLDWELLNQGSDGAPIYSPFSIRSINIRTDVYVEELESKEYTVSLGYMQADAVGGRVHGDIQTKFLALSALQNADVVYMINEWHERVLVKIEPGLSYQFVREDTGQSPSLIVHFRVTVMGRQFYFDVGQPYDSVFAWGP